MVQSRFDYVMADASIDKAAAIRSTQVRVATQYSMFDYDETERGWVRQDMSQIHTEADFEAFPWPDPDQLDYSNFEAYSRLLPPGMKIMGSLGKIFNSVWWLMGFQHFAECLVENPGLIQRMFEKVGTLQLAVLDRMLEFDAVEGIKHADDIAYSEALMIAPNHLRQYVFPWFKELVNRVHAKGKLAIFHSDGKLDLVMPDLVGCGFDALNPFEPKAIDIVAVKQQYGDKIALIGNIDLGYTLTRGTPAEVAAECRQRIRELGPGGGYALASSNSIPEYVPYENFLALLNSAFEYGQYPLEPLIVEERPLLVTTEVARKTVDESDSDDELTLLDELIDAVVDGDPDDARIITREALDDDISAHQMFNQALIPAMTEVGQLMETGEYFIPSVLMSAKAMNASVDILKPLLVEAAEHVEKVGKVVIGTVHRDMHDIGKNLAIMMLEGKGFDVIDLGIDVPTEKFIEAVKEHNADIVGMSAMLTTTMMNMKDVIDALTEAGLRDRVKVIIGGAPVEPYFAAEIGADGAALNAAAGANMAYELVTGKKA